MEGGKFKQEISVDKYFGPFRVTALWNQIINHLRRNVSIGRQRYLIWQYEDVFTGQDAADSVLHFLQQKQSEIPNDVTRQNAVKVCQCLMDYQVFEAINKNQHLQRFEDSSSNLYRFKEQESNELYKKLATETNKDPEKENITLRLQVPSVSSEREAVLINPNYDSDSPTPSMYSLQVQLYKKRSASLDPSSIYPVSEDILSPSLSLNSFQWKPNSFSRHRGLRRRHTFLSDDKLPDTGTDAARQHLQRKVSFFQKGRTLRKSFVKTLRPSNNQRLETIFTNVAAIKTKGNPPPNEAITSNVSTLPFKITKELHQKLLSRLLCLVDIPILEAILSVPPDLPRLTPTGDRIALGRETTDWDRIPWLEAATACTNCALSGVNSLWSGQSCKLHCYKSVLEYYRRLPSCLLPGAFFQVYLATVQLLRQKRPRRARNVLRLLVRVLPENRACQLEALVGFLRMASEDMFVSLDKKLSNREAILRDFSQLVLLHPLLSSEYCTSFFDFLLAHSTYIFANPTPLLTQRTVGFCRRISKEEAEEQQRRSTERALKKLFFVISKSTLLSSKVKKNLLKKFQKVHPHVVCRASP